MHNPSASQTHTWSSMMGDYIGMESCVDLEQDEQVVVDGGCSEDKSIRRRCCGQRERRWEARREKKDYPPPIPLLARTENQQPHMPWVLKRYYSGDGRLIIREEKVKHHEYFRVHRSNGRLTLQLVPLDDEVLPLSPLFGDDEEEIEDNNVESNQDQDDGDECEVGIVDGGDETSKDRSVEEAVAVRLLPEPTTVESRTAVVGGGGKWYNYSSVRSNPCMYGMPVPAIRPVHI